MFSVSILIAVDVFHTKKFRPGNCQFSITLLLRRVTNQLQRKWRPTHIYIPAKEASASVTLTERPTSGNRRSVHHPLPHPAPLAPPTTNCCFSAVLVQIFPWIACYFNFFITFIFNSIMREYLGYLEIWTLKKMFSESLCRFDEFSKKIYACINRSWLLW